MTLAAAQVSANSLATALRDYGVKTSIELQPGVAESGWHVGTFKRGLGHHIASRPSMGLTPGLAAVKNGRGGASPLSGPLANGYGGYDRIARIITMAWANHPGAGGPWPVPGWGTIPLNNGRPYIFGWEFEGGYEPYTDEMHDFMARCGAATLDWLGNAPLACWDEHKGWAGPRKPDRIGYTTASGRARIAAVRGTSEEKDWFDMATKEELEVIVRKAVNERLDVPSLKAVASHLDPNVWWLTNGITRRPMIGWTDFERMEQLGLAERHRPELGEAGVIAVIEDAVLQAIPIVSVD